MNAVSFDFLNEVSDVEIENGVVYFKLHQTLNSSSPAYITARITPKSTQISVEFNHTNDPKNSVKFNHANDPQNSFDQDVDCYAVDCESIALVDDFDNVHAIQDMPFILTGSQKSKINAYLEDIAIDEMVA